MACYWTDRSVQYLIHLSGVTTCHAFHPVDPTTATRRHRCPSRDLPEDVRRYSERLHHRRERPGRVRRLLVSCSPMSGNRRSAPRMENSSPSPSHESNRCGYCLSAHTAIGAVAWPYAAAPSPGPQRRIDDGHTAAALKLAVAINQCARTHRRRRRSRQHERRVLATREIVEDRRSRRAQCVHQLSEQRRRRRPSTSLKSRLSRVLRNPAGRIDHDQPDPTAVHAGDRARQKCRLPRTRGTAATPIGSCWLTRKTPSGETARSSSVGATTFACFLLEMGEGARLPAQEGVVGVSR